MTLYGLPETIEIGGFTYAVEPLCVADDPDAFGRCDKNGQKILLDPGMTSGQRVADTVMHEINHAIWNVFGLDAFEHPATEEEVISLLSSAWVQVYRANPWLLGWLNASLHGPKDHSKTCKEM